MVRKKLTTGDFVREQEATLKIVETLVQETCERLAPLGFEGFHLKMLWADAQIALEAAGLPPLRLIALKSILGILGYSPTEKCYQPRTGTTYTSWAKEQRIEDNFLGIPESQEEFVERVGGDDPDDRAQACDDYLYLEIERQAEAYDAWENSPEGQALQDKRYEEYRASLTPEELVAFDAKELGGYDAAVRGCASKFAPISLSPDKE